MVTKQCQTCVDRGLKPVPTVEGTESQVNALLAQHDLSSGHAQPKGKQKMPFEHICSEGHVLIAKTPEARDKLINEHAEECDG